MKKFIALVISVLMAVSIVVIPGSAAAPDSTNATYYNTADLRAADPAVMYDEKSGYYYAYSTDGATNGYRFGIYRSADMVTWELLPNGALKGENQWGNDWFWAPECYYNPETGWYFLFYAARIRSGTDLAEKHFGYRVFDEACKIGVAVSRSPEGPFENISNEPIDYYPYDPEYYDINLIMPDQNKPPLTLEEGMTAPKGTYLPTIDANVFFDDDGRIYLYFSRNCYRNWVWDSDLNKYLEESNIYCVELETDWWNDPEAKTVPTVTEEYYNANKSADDPEDVRKDGFVPVINYAMEKQEWENAHINRVPTNRRWAEGSTTIKYYFDKDNDGVEEPYQSSAASCNNWENEWYGVGYAVAESPLGPWDKYDLNPILELNEDMSGTGHGSIGWSPDGEDMFYVYHGRLGTTGSRKLFQDKLTIDEDNIDEGTGLPTVSIDQSVTDRPVPSGVYYSMDDCDPVTVTAGAQSSTEFEVRSSTGGLLPMSNRLNRVVAEVADDDVATAEIDGNQVKITGVSGGKTQVTLKYQRLSSDGTYYDVLNTTDGVESAVQTTFDVTVASASVIEGPETASINEVFTFKVATSEEVAGIKLYSEYGNAIGIRNLSVEDVDGQRIWTVSASLGTKGEARQIKVYTKAAGGAFTDSYAQLSIDITVPELEVKEMSFAADSVQVNQNVQVDVLTSGAAKDINIRNSEGQKDGQNARCQNCR